MKHRIRYVITAGLVVAGTFLVYLVLAKRDSGPTSEKSDLLAALQTSSVEVNNGEAAVLKNSQGYVLVVPVKRTLEDLRVTAYASKSGVFGRDAIKVLDENCRVDRRIIVGGSEVQLEGGSDSSVYVTLDIGDARTQIALSKASALGQVNASALVFNGNPGFDSKQAFERFRTRNGIK